MTELAQGEPARRACEVALQRADRRPGLRLHAAQRRRRTRSSPTTTELADGPTGPFAAGETVDVRVAFDNWLAPSRYTLTPVDRARADCGADALDLREDLASLIVHGGRDTGGVVDLPHSSRSSARERGSPRRRRYAPVGASATTCGASASLTLTLADDRLQAALLRLGARLRLDAGAPAALFGVLYVVFTQVVQLGEGVKNYPVYLLDRDRPVRRSSARRRAAACSACVDRESLLRKMRFPRLVIPLSVALTALFNLGDERSSPCSSSRSPSGIEPRLELARAAAARRAARDCSRPASGCCSACSSCASATSQPIWEVFAQILFYASPVLYVDHHGRPAAASTPYIAQPARRDPHPDAPRGRSTPTPRRLAAALGGGGSRC